MTRRPSRLVLLGHPVAHSLSPVIQNAALRAAAIPLAYEALDVPPARLDDALATLTRQGAAGNVTIPHKERVAARCARLTRVAERVGAANTFWVDDGSLLGDNTDVGGFDHLVRALIGRTLAGAHIALLGAGGGARAVLAAVEGWRECTVSLYSRTTERAAALAAHFPVVTDVRARPEDAAHGAALVVNATPVGLTNDHLPVALEALAPGAVIIDLAYRRGETAWVRIARARGHLAADGMAMLVEQGALAFERWLGIPAPRDVMWRALG